MRWLRQQGPEIVILSGPGDADVARQLYTSDNRQAILVAGVTTLTESVTLMSHAAMFLGNDSGPGHIAGALGVPTLIVMASHEECRPSGPSSPTRIRPFGPHVVCCQPKHCLSPCDDYCTADAAHCITGISVEEALDNHAGATSWPRPRSTPSPGRPRPRRHPRRRGRIS